MKNVKKRKKAITCSSNWKPCWLNSLTDKKMKDISDIFLFFVIETPLVKERYRGKDFEEYGWNIAKTPCANHINQAFSKGSVTINEAHNIGVKFQEEMWPLTFTTVMVTHSNKDNIHNHMIIIPTDNESFNEKKLKDKIVFIFFFINF